MPMRAEEAEGTLALGLMSGTSLDGIDAALLTTNGETVVSAGGRMTVAYDEALRARLRSILGSTRRTAEVAAVEVDLTQAHADAVRRLLAQEDLSSDQVRVVGFHGHTILHRPPVGEGEAGRTWQIGDGALLAREIGIDVVADLRGADMAAGGQGAPLAPVLHAALAAALEKPLAVLNLGGVANVTWIGPAGGARRIGPGGGASRIDADSALIAFDTGPGNALIDDWALAHTGRPLDEDGRLAATGRVNAAALAALMKHPYFERSPPKSLDRDDFSRAPVQTLSSADGAATLTAFTAEAVARAARYFPAPARRWLVCGGGRRNPALIAALAMRLGAPVEPVEAVGWDGDALEAQAFALLAVRSLRGLPLSYPGTTGVRSPTTGGRLHPRP